MSRLPTMVVLPTGRSVELRVEPAKQAPNDLLSALDRGVLSLPDDLALCDANVIEGVLVAAGVIAPEPVRLVCRNCEEDHEVRPRPPLAPLVRAGDDEELDRPGTWDRDEWHELPSPIATKRGEVSRFRLLRRRLEHRRRLEELLRDADALPLSPALVRAIGLESFGTNSPSAIARTLEALDDATFHRAWDAIARAFDEQHWPPRLLAEVACPSCGAAHDLEAVKRPLEWFEDRPEHEGEAFPDLEAFRARAAAITREVFTASKIDDLSDLEVIVYDDVPPCDDGGEPLLGSYTPGREGEPHEIALYFRTFRSMYADEPYDVDEEIRETIDHELEHHVGFLRGDDPLDDAERAEIVRERARRMGVSAEKAQVAASLGWLAADFARFVRSTWPIWIAALIAAFILLAANR